MSRGKYRDENRDNGAVELYYAIYRSRMRSGHSHEEARDEAFDAVELRYSISAKTLRNIIYQTPSKLDSNKKLFYEDTDTLIEILEETIKDKITSISRDEMLLEVLKESINDGERNS